VKVSSFLYGLGRAAFRRRVAVLIAWLGVLVVLAGIAGVAGGKFEDKFNLPGTESQTALDSLARTFPQVTGTTAQLIVIPPAGTSVRETGVRKAIEATTKRIDDLDRVSGATSPFDKYAKGVISEDDSAAIIVIRLKDQAQSIPAATIDAMNAETVQLQNDIPGSRTSIGGDAYNNNVPSFSIVEGLGVVIAMVVLFLTLGSFRAAGMPLITAILGVGLTMTVIVGATAVITISSTTPLLAVMLGLAVGIDYALFIVSRHRDQLSAGMEVEESVARAVATAGSAVVFAGVTVMIALAGLSVAGIPFLSTMGVAAAVGVAIAVLIALTLLPAMLGFAGAKLTPKVRTPKAAKAKRTTRNSPRSGRARLGFARRWVRLVTKVPILTAVIVITALGVLAYPAKDLQIALPSPGHADPGSHARVTYDLVSDHFGAGYNGPLIVSATIVGSDDPLGVMDDIADEIRAVPGVASVPLSTPNADASTGIIQVIPETGPDTPETKDLVRRIRALEPHILAKYDIPIAVTGFTAVAIDISDRLGHALIPFGILVVGLSLILLAMVFRSIAVPLKATIGYLLSVGAAFGVTAMVFEYNWFGSLVNVHEPAPVISFLPILLMGILFGLAMDYEVFLVSRIREEYVHKRSRKGGDPLEPMPSAQKNTGPRDAAHAAIEDGFAASSRVVAAAAVIMIGVFAAFVPEGEGAIKPISLGLAVGVFVDAFLVRMTLVPAVLALLGESAWWLPKWLDRRLPSFDVEGAGLVHQVSLADWPAPNDRHLVYADGLDFGGRAPVAISALPREVVVVDGLPDTDRTALLLTLAGRMKITIGRAKVGGLVLPEQAGQVRARTGYLDCATSTDLRRDLRVVAKAKPKIIFIDHADLLSTHDDRAALASLLDDLGVQAHEQSVVLAVRHQSSIADLVPGPFTSVTLGRSDDLIGAPTH
jgi:RND superfamily putative drug exporter